MSNPDSFDDAEFLLDLVARQERCAAVCPNACWGRNESGELVRNEDGTLVHLLVMPRSSKDKSCLCPCHAQWYTAEEKAAIRANHPDPDRLRLDTDGLDDPLDEDGNCIDCDEEDES